MKWFFLVLFCFSCGDSNFPKVEKIGEFRVLAIIADSPEVSAGGSTNVYPYVSDVDGGGRTVTGSYEACVDPGVSFGATPSCKDIPGTVTGDYSIDFSADSDFAANNYTGLASDPVAVNVPAIIFNGRDAQERFNGVSVLVIFKFVVDGKTISAFRRIVATERGEVNTNPAAPTILFNGGSFSTKPAKDDRLSVDSTADEETYSVKTVDGDTETRKESYEVAWYVSGGELSKAKTGSTESTKFTKSPSNSKPFVGVVFLRDERGGVSYARVNVP